MPICRIQTEQGPQWVSASLIDGEMWLSNISSSAQEDHVQPYELDFVPRRLDPAELLAPVVPSKIVCVGRNYRDHAAELGNEVPKEPLLFLKPPSSLLRPEGTIQRPAASARVDFEGELGVVMGSRASKLGPDADVWPLVRGFCCVNDVTARDLQKSDGQWGRAKGFDTFCPAGPWLTALHEVAPEGAAPPPMQIETRVNGDLRQHGTTADLIFDIPFLIKYISNIMTLEPGDLIATGTPAGVGPLAAGDIVEVTVTGLGTLRNRVQ